MLSAFRPRRRCYLSSATIWFLGAAWALARAAIDKDQAWLAVIMLIVTTGFYGAYQVFHYSESYLTARTLAEALVVTAWPHISLAGGGWD